MKKYEGIMKFIWRAQGQYWRKCEEIWRFFANRLYLKEEEALNFSKSQGVGWSSEFFQVSELRRKLGIFLSPRNMKKYEGVQFWEKTAKVADTVEVVHGLVK